MLTKTDAKGQVFTYSYDAVNRLVFVDAPGVEDDIQYEYDTCAGGVGRLCAVTYGPAGADPEIVTYAYNAFGEVLAHQGVNYGYDESGRVESLIYPSGVRIEYAYDSAGGVSRVDATLADGAPVTLASGVAHAPFGPVTGLTYGNGLSLSRGMDSAYRYTDVTVTGALSLANLLYDGNGNLQSRDNGPIAESFGYDALNRLGSANGTFGTRAYHYDQNGNRTQKSADSTVIDYAYEFQSNRLESETGWTYELDANGNTLSRLDGVSSGLTYAYSAHNRLIGVSNGAAYRYNGLGQRVEKSFGVVMTRFVYGLGASFWRSWTATGSPGGSTCTWTVSPWRSSPTVSRTGSWTTAVRGPWPPEPGPPRQGKASTAPTT